MAKKEIASYKTPRGEYRTQLKSFNSDSHRANWSKRMEGYGYKVIGFHPAEQVINNQ